MNQVLSEAELINLRQGIPLLGQTVNQHPIIYFDHAATSPTPQRVIDCLVHHYQHERSNIHRSVHYLGYLATEAYEESRELIQGFIGAKHREEVLFNSGTTEGLNWLARGLVGPQLKVGDAIMVTALEHHANLVPWQVLAKEKNVDLLMAPIDLSNNKVDLVSLRLMDTSHVKVLAIHHSSNVLGVSQPIKELVEWAHQQDIIVIIDGAQAVAHQPINVEALGVDAYCFSGHKLYGPTGIGVCYLNRRWHNLTEPLNYGGEMIAKVSLYESHFAQAPMKFEGGTPPIAQAIGLGEAIKYIQAIGWDTIQAGTAWATRRLIQGLERIEGVTIYGHKADQMASGIVSFNIEGIHPHDVATAYDSEGIAVRAGHHCAQPLLNDYLKQAACVRASLGCYHTAQEVDYFIQVTHEIKEFFQR